MLISKGVEHITQYLRNITYTLHIEKLWISQVNSFLLKKRIMIIKNITVDKYLMPTNHKCTWSF